MKATRLLATMAIGFLFPSFVVAASGEGIPFATVTYQIANIIILIALLYFSQKKTISLAFAQKRKDYLATLEEASESKRAAQQKLDEVSSRLTNMTQTFDEQVQQAKIQAQKNYEEQLQKAKAEAGRLSSLALLTLEYEVQKQIEKLRIETFRKSADLAEQNLHKNISPEQLKSWNNHFSLTSEGAH